MYKKIKLYIKYKHIYKNLERDGLRVDTGRGKKTHSRHVTFSEYGKSTQDEAEQDRSSGVGNFFHP